MVQGLSLSAAARQWLADRHDRIVETETDGRVATFAAVDRRTGRPVTARLFGINGHSPDIGEALTEYVARLARLSSDRVLKLLDHQEVRANGTVGLLVIQEAPAGEPLSAMLPSFRAMIAEEGRLNRGFCFFAAQMAEALQALHGAGVIHQAVTPDSFLFDPATRSLKLDGLARAPESAGLSPVTSEAVLPYISPEQAGRMSHTVDFRANLYSLGVLFYEMMTGVTPFSASDATGVLYGHTALTPIPPSEVNPAVDVVLSRLVLKLLAKHPDDRYQSAAGLLADLAGLACRFDAAARVPDFNLGRNDVSPVFTLPDRLYGREQTLSCLQKCFDRICAGDTCVVMIAGDTGVGKTEVVRRLGAYVREAGGIFLAGKFDQHQQAVPIRAPKTAMDSAARWLLSQSPEKIQIWREKILSAVSPNGQILVDIIPEMELVIGKQPPVCELPPMEAIMRVGLVMEKFGSLFLEKDHPVVFFLDDMQWADKGSLSHGIAFLLARQRRYCMVLGTYRDNEVDEDHPLTRYLSKLKRTSIPVEIFRLEHLDEGQTAAMVADILCQTDEVVAPLARIVFKKTGGNPFFIRQFMSSLHAGGLICYDMRRGNWSWDADRIAAADITDNVARLLSTAIDKLPVETLSVLQAAACVGNRIDPDLLARVLSRDLSDIVDQARTALKAGLLRVYVDPSPSRQASGKEAAHIWEFAHDHILQAVYRTLPEAAARDLHWAVGKAMLAREPTEGAGNKIFDIVYQLRLGMPPDLSPPETTEIARLNLMAGRNAMESVSFGAAAPYLRHACDLLPPTAWETDYDLCAAIHASLAKCEFVLGAFDASERLFGLLLQKAPSLPDRARAYNAMIELHTAAGNIDKALMLGRRGLEMLGILLPRHPSRLKVLLLLSKLRFVWGFRRLSTIMDIPENKDELLNIQETLLTNIGLPAFYVDPLLCLWLTATGILLGIRDPGKGVPLQHASLGLITLGAFLGSMFGFIGMGRSYAKIGMRLLERQSPGPHQAIAYFVSAFFNRHWYQPARKNINYFKRAYRHAMKSGDISYAGHSINSMFMVHFFLGDNLDTIYADHKRYQAFVQNSRSPFVVATYMAIQQFYRSLKGQTASPFSLSEPGYDEEVEFAAAVEGGNLMLQFFFLLFQLKLLVIFRQWDKAMAVADRIRARNYLPAGTLVLTEYYFYAFLSAMAVVSTCTDRQQVRRCRQQAALSMKKMKQWRRLRPDNFEPMLRLMEAEQARAGGRPSKVLRLYRQAVSSAVAGGFTHLAAIACESAGIFLAGHGDKIASRAYLVEAKRTYETWGATAKVRDMEKQYAAVLSVMPERTPSVLERMDYNAVVEALQAVSQEIVVRKLLTRLMEITMAATGANRAAFISSKNNQLFVEVEGRGDEAGRTLLKTEPLLDQKKTLMASVVYYVKRTQQLVVINDMKKAPAPFQRIGDAINPPRSLVCMPMSRSERLVGILYLENTLTGGIFTEDRLELLKLIASQAAISFENATLYEHVMKNEQDLKQLSEKLRNLYSELMLTEERERRRIATELHDRIGHALAGTKIGLEAMAQAPGADHRQRLNDILQTIEQSIADTRTLTFEISPPILYHLGLGAALDWLCEETQQKHGVAITFTDMARDAAIEQKTEVLCFQILRELLFNAVKHARAGHINVALRMGKDRLRLTIQDDGIGFDQSRQPSSGSTTGGGFGLFSIHERLRLVGGQMEIDTGENRGTRIDIIIPLAAAGETPRPEGL
ncbi:MAG: AAA family ATPase [Thermodesulfobacteriota bacterium]